MNIDTQISTIRITFWLFVPVVWTIVFIVHVFVTNQIQKFIYFYIILLFDNKNGSIKEILSSCDQAAI